MPHQRNRHATAQIRKLASFWPIVGVVGLRQVGKSTLLRDLVGGLQSESTFDDEGARSAAEASAKVFLARLAEPALIDEVQKVPEVFDALKASVDREKRPGRFFITGSTEFSARLGIRESLTGRIGLLHLHPMTLSEMHGLEFDPSRASPLHSEAPRFTIDQFSKTLSSGGLPVPAFIRDESQRQLYFQSWIETAVFRDAARAFGRSYDPEFALRLLTDIAEIQSQGQLPTTSILKYDARKMKRYFLAFQDVFLIRKVLCHTEGVGKDAYIISDSGIAAHLMGSSNDENANRSLARIRILSQIETLHAYQGKTFIPEYYKSQRGEPVDLVWNNIPIKVTANHKISGWDTRSLEGAMKKLKSSQGIIAAPIDQPVVEQTGISVVPWSYWS